MTENGEKPRAIPVGIIDSLVRSTEVHLEDGSTLAIQLVPTKVARIEDQKGGNEPVYHMEYSTVMRVKNTTPHLRGEVHVEN